MEHITSLEVACLDCMTIKFLCDCLFAFMDMISFKPMDNLGRLK